MAPTTTGTLTRRSVLSGALAALAVVVTARPAPAQPAPPLPDRLAGLERRDNRIIGLSATDLVTGRTVTHRADESFAMCSTFKTYLAGAVLQRVQYGELGLDEQLPVTPAAITVNSPRTEPHAGGRMRVADLCAAALQVSDNGAANVLLAALGGPAAVTAFARSIGDERTRLDRWEPQLNAAVPGDPRDTSTPAALAAGYRRLLEGDALAPAQRDRLRDWMLANETSALRAGLPAGWTSADKTGSGDYGTTNDVGIAYGPAGQRVLLAIMTRSAADDEQAANLRPLIGEVTGAVLAALAG